MGNKGTDTTTTTSAPNPAAMSSYYDVLARAQRAASKPYEAYPGQLTADVNDYMRRGAQNIDLNAAGAQPYFDAATGYAAEGGENITAEDIARHQDPYVQQVIDATQAQLAEDNARQQQQVVGNAAAQGALGGDRVGVAQALTADAQTRSQAPVIAGLYSRAYEGARTAAEAEKARKGTTAALYGNLGLADQRAGIEGGQAQYGVGEQLRGVEQSDINAKREEYFRSQGYDFQTAQWLAAIAGSIGSQMGGTSTTTPPQPNPWVQAAGLALSAVPFINTGGRVNGRAAGGEVAGVMSAPGWVPTNLQLAYGKGPPEPPKAGEPQKADTKGMAKGLAALGSKASDWLSGAGDPMDLTAPNQGSSVGVGGINLEGNLGGFYAPGGGVGSIDPVGPQQAPQPTMQPPMTSQPPMQPGFGAPSWPGKMSGAGGINFNPTATSMPPMELGRGPRQPWWQRGQRSGLGFAEGGEVDVAMDLPISVGLSGNAFEDRFSPVDEIRPDYSRPETMELRRGLIDRGYNSPSREAPVKAPEYPAEFFSPRISPMERPTALGYAPAEGGVETKPSSELPVDTTEDVRGRGVVAIGPGFRGAGVGTLPRRLLSVPGTAGEAGGFSKGLLGNPLGLSDEAKQGLISLGLSMMANRRGGPGSFLSALGEGGQEGMTTYSDALTKTAAARRQALLDRQKAAEAADKRAFELEKFNRPYREMTAAEKARIEADREKARAERLSPGYRWKADGSGQEFIPGGSADPEVLRRNKEATTGASEKALPAELGARISLAGKFLDEYPLLRREIQLGSATGPLDQAWGRLGMGTQGEIHRKLKAGKEALLRNLTGAGMNLQEASDYAEQFSPAFRDTADQLLSKADQLADVLRRTETEAYRGRGEIPKARTDARAAANEAIQRIEAGEDPAPILADLNQRFGIKFMPGAISGSTIKKPAAPRKPQTIIQNGHTYHLQPDGSYK